MLSSIPTRYSSLTNSETLRHLSKLVTDKQGGLQPYIFLVHNQQNLLLYLNYIIQNLTEKFDIVWFFEENFFQESFFLMLKNMV